MHQRLKDRLLAWWGSFVSRHPVLVLTVALVPAALSVLVTLAPIPIPGTKRHIGPLQFQSNRNDLISAKLEWNKRFIRWQKGFPGTTDLIVVADAGPEGPQRADQARCVQALMSELGPALSKDPWVERAVWGFDKLKVSPKAIRVADLNEKAPTDDFRARLAQVAESRSLLASPNPQSLIGSIVAELNQQEREDAAGTEEQAIRGLRDLAGVLNAFNQSLSSQSGQPTDLGQVVISQEEPGGLWQYLVTDNGRLYFIRVTPRMAQDQINALGPAIASIQQTTTTVAARHRGVEVGLTGIDVVEAEETDAATWDGTSTSIVAAVLITVLMILAYHSFRMPLMHMLALLVAVAWTFGFTTLAVGHLQVISVVFVPLLLSLGIAYGIYLNSRFEMIRHEHPDTPEGFAAAMSDTFQKMGPGIMTGCVTTAAAFLMTLFTDFTGVAEMGLISGVGIVLCLLAMFTAFPALVRLVKPAHRHIPTLDRRYVRFYHDAWFLPFARRPWWTLVAATVLTLASLASLIDMRFDYNLLKLQPAGTPSVEWERRIIEDGGESIWFGVSIVKDLDEARKLATLYRRKPTVALVRGVGLLIPDDEARKIELLKAAAPPIEAAIAQGKKPPPPGPDLLTQVAVLQLAFNAQSKRPDIPGKVRPHIQAAGQALERLATTIQSLPDEQRQQRLARLSQEFARWRGEVETMVPKALDPTPLGLDDLPPEILAPYRGADGSLSLEIFPRLPDPKTSPVRDALDPHFLPRFVADMRAVDPYATGVVVQIYESGRLIQESYVFAGALGLLVVFLLVIFDFQSVRDALLCLLPVVTGFAVTFGIMRLLGMSINAANIIVLPLMFGIGVDSGVHMIYRHRMDPDGRPPGLTQGTGIGIIIVNITAIIGFGVMAIPYMPWLGIGVRHRGILSLGFVLATGMAMTLLACLTIMPAWLELRNRKRRRAAG